MVGSHLIKDVVAPLTVLEVDEPGLFEQEVLGPGAYESEIAIVLQLDVLACCCALLRRWSKASFLVHPALGTAKQMMKTARNPAGQVQALAPHLLFSYDPCTVRPLTAVLERI